MKITIFTLLLVTLLSNCVLAQKEELSPTAKYLESRVKEGDYNAILEAGNSGDITLLPYLRQLTEDVKGRSNSNSPAFKAHIALVKLGDGESMRQIFEELNSDSYAVQDMAIKKMSLIGGKEVFKKFYQLLDNSELRDKPNCANTWKDSEKDKSANNTKSLCFDIAYFPISATVMLFLSKMVDNPPDTKRAIKLEEKAQIWKDWFEKNKYLIE